MTGDIASQIAAHRGNMTAREVSELTTLAVPTLYEMARENRIPAMRIGLKVIFNPAKVAAWWRSKETA